MTRISEAGFETGDASELASNTGCTVGAVSPRTGRYSILVPASNFVSGFSSLDLGSNTYDGIYCRVAVKLESSTPPGVANTADLIRYETQQSLLIGVLQAVINTNGTVDLVVRRADNTVLTTVTNVGINSNTYKVIEFYARCTVTGTYYVRVDGIQVATGTGNFGNAKVSACKHGNIGPSTSGCDIRFDDITLDDAAFVGTGNPITLVGVSGAVSVASGNLTLTEPTAAQQNDILVAMIAYRSTAAFTLPAGWNLAAPQLSGGNTGVGGIVSELMAYIARGASAPDLTFVRSGGDVAIGAIIAIRGNGTPTLDGGTSDVSASSTTLVTGTGITTTADEAFLIIGGAMSRSTSGSLYQALTDPAAANWIELIDAPTVTGATASVSMAYAKKPLAGATGNPRYNAASNGRHGIAFAAFKPAITTVYNQAISASVAASVSVRKSMGKAIAATATTTTTLRRSIGKRIAATATTTTTLRRSIGKRIAATVTTSVAFFVPKTARVTITITVGTTVTLTRSIGKRIAAVLTGSVSVLRDISKSISATATTTANVIVNRAFLVLISADVGTSVDLRKSVGKAVNASVSSAVSLSRSIGKRIAATATTTTTLRRDVAVRIAATATTTTTLRRDVAVRIAATATTTTTLRRSIGKYIAASVSSAVSVAIASVQSWLPLKYFEGGVWKIGRLKMWRNGTWVRPPLKIFKDGHWQEVD